MIYLSTLLLLKLLTNFSSPTELSTTTFACSRTADSLVLVDLYNATNGSNWTNTWNLNQPIDTWYGITIDGGGCVTDVNLIDNNLVGTIPTTTGNLENLENLYLQNNQLSSSIPSELGNLSNLLRLEVAGNQLSGNIPSSLGDLSNLISLTLNVNQLSGSIPAEIGDLADLKTLYLGDNLLTGSLPAALGNLGVLERLRLWNNQLTGSIPATFGGMDSLIELSAFNNQLSGSIPSELGDLSKLHTLSLYQNQLTGSIPAELGDLNNLEILVLSNNQLSGTLPTELGDLSALVRFQINSNSISGSIPTTLGMLTNLQFFIANDNNLDSAIPVEIGNLSSLLQLYLSRNDLTDTIPDALWNLTNLTHLYLNENDLSGSLSENISNLTQLTLFRVNSNNLNGDLPDGLWTLTNLRELFLLNNGFTGNIPPEVENLVSLQLFRLEDNNLSGSLPDELGNLPQVTFIWLQDNNLSGNIPAALGNLSTLTNLRLQSNNLDGNIPPQLSNLENLTSLYLFNNNLTGELPPELSQLTAIQEFRLNDNNLSGCYPIEYTFFCNPSINATFSGNLSLPDFTNFCDTGGGACLENDECVDATLLPMNLDPCGINTEEVILDGATLSPNGPYSICNAAFSSKDVWFKAIIPSTGNFLIRKDSATNIRLYVEAYMGCPNSAMDTLSCAYLNEKPNVLVIDLETSDAGQEIYFRLWDSLDLIVNQVGIATAQISAHQLSENPDEWELCDFKESTAGASDGSGTRKANEVIIQYEKGATEAERAALRQENGIGINDFRECKCSNVPIEVWKTTDPVELEDKRKRVAQSTDGRQDTTGYNYVINIVPLLDTLKERQVSENTFGDQLFSDVAMDAAGNYVVVWQSDSDIYARLFDALGTPKGSAFRVNNGTSGTQRNPSVSMQSNGDFIVSWEGNSQTLFPFNSISLKRYDKDGNVTLTDQIIAQDDFDTSVSDPSIDINNSGSYVITYNIDGLLGLFVKIELYNNDNNLVSEPIIFDSNEEYHLPHTAIAENGKFMVVASKSPINGGTETYEIIKQFYDNMGNPIGTKDIVNITLPETQIDPFVTIDSLGNSLIAWTENNSSDAGNIKARRYDSNGNPITGELSINTTLSNIQTINHLAMDKDGNYIVVWESEGQDGDEGGIYAQYFNQNGNPIANEFRVNDKTTGDQAGAAVSMNQAGQVIFTWHDEQTDYDIISKRYFRTSLNSPLKNVTTSTDTIGIQKDTYTNGIYTPMNTVGDVIIATLDSGIDSLHANFQNAFWKYDGSGICKPDNVLNDIGYDFFNNDRDPDDVGGHGTALNGILVENFPNDLNLDLMNLKFYEEGKSTLFDAICAIYYAIEQNADVLNLSWGFESEEVPTILKDALDYAACNNVIVVTSAGNTGENNNDILKYPSNFSEIDNNIITVAAYEVDENGNNQQLSGYSNFGSKVDIAARGFIETTGLDNTFVSLSGTSLATPVVARVAAIIKARYPQLSALEIKDCILNTVDDFDFDIATSGALNEVAALNCAMNKVAVTCESDKLQLNANVTEESCTGSDGSIDLIVSGEEENPTFEWSNGATTEDLNGLISNTYMVTVTDECGCEKTLSIEVQNECNGGNCQTDQVLNNDPIIGSIYRASDSIESAGRIEDGTNVEFRAGQIVELKAGFHAEKETNFIAKIEGCTSSMNGEIEARTTIDLAKSMQLEVFPNPTASQTNVRYFLSKIEVVQIGLYDLNGRLLQTIAVQQSEAGWNRINLSVDHLSTGIYFIRLQSADNQMIQKLVVGE